MSLLWGLVVAVIPFILFLYIRQNDKALQRLPPDAAAFSPERPTMQDFRLTAERLGQSPLSVLEQLPPRTGRRYIIVGGAGFLGGWIVVQLLQRGEDPRKIRILDIRAPTRSDLTTGIAKDVHFIQLDISDTQAVDAAFKAPWPSIASTEPAPPISIFHTASTIRFYERHRFLLPRSASVNVDGTRNIINAARAIGASTLVYTSSGSVAVRRSRLWLWPWEKEPKYFVQVINDDDNLIPKRHEHFFSNYAVTKMNAERLVREADGCSSGDGVLKTGCLRPGNGIYGPGGDSLFGAALLRKTNPTFVPTILQSFVYVENCSLAHLCYEQRLIEISRGTRNPDIGGQAFTITNPGPPYLYGDVYSALVAFDDDVHFPLFSPTFMMLLAHILELYYIAQNFLLPYLPSIASRFFLQSDLVNLQPAMCWLVMVHLIFDDSRARLSPEKGGLGYNGAWTTLEGIYKTAIEHKNASLPDSDRYKTSGLTFGGARRKRNHIIDKVSSEKLVPSVVKPAFLD